MVPERESQKKIVYLYVSNDFTDFEPAIALDMISKRNLASPPRLRSFDIMSFGNAKTPVKSLAGLTILPDTDIAGVDLSSAAMIILPGITELAEKDNPPLTRLLLKCRDRRIPVAAICGATVFLAKCGLLDTVRHTSNGPAFLKQAAPHYKGEALYEQTPCVSDRGIITANPFGHVEFACEIFRALEAMPPEVIDFFPQGYKKGYVNFDLVPGQTAG